LPGFSGTLSPSKSIYTGRGESASTPIPYVPRLRSVTTFSAHHSANTLQPETQEDLEDEESAEDEVAEASSALHDILTVCLDTNTPT
jgi:hypothetical protein